MYYIIYDGHFSHSPRNCEVFISPFSSLNIFSKLFLLFLNPYISFAFILISLRYSYYTLKFYIIVFIDPSLLQIFLISPSYVLNFIYCLRHIIFSFHISLSSSYIHLILYYNPYISIVLILNLLVHEKIIYFSSICGSLLSSTLFLKYDIN